MQTTFNGFSEVPVKHHTVQKSLTLSRKEWQLAEENSPMEETEKYSTKANLSTRGLSFRNC